MVHYGHAIKLTRETPKEWLKFTSQIGELANTWSGRNDLTAYVGDNAGQGKAPALFMDHVAEIEVNREICFGKGATPEMVGDLRQRSAQLEFPTGAGALWHEAMHARFSTWDLQKAAEKLTYFENDALHLLEETRMEKQGLKIQPENRVLIRSTALEIAIGDMEPQPLVDQKGEPVLGEDGKQVMVDLTDTRAAAKLAALSLARVDNGALEEKDVLAVRAKIEPILGDDLHKTLRRIWLDFQAISDPSKKGAIEKMYALAKEWNKVVQETAEERGEGSEEDQMYGGGEGAAERAKKAMKSIMDALAEDAAATGIAAGDEAQDQATKERYKAEQKKAEADAKESMGNQETANKVFGRGTGPVNSNSYSKLIEKRKPKSEEHIAAVRLGRDLERAKYRDRRRIEGSSAAPPGRLRTRGMVQNAAYREQGSMQTTEPWRRVMHKQTDEPKLTIGVIVDISSSMTPAMQPMATTAWVLSEAIRRVQGRTAMVYYGNDVFPTLKPGQHLNEVHVYSAADGTEKFDKAFRAIDGALELTRGTGARMLVVCSDGYYTSEEQRAARKWIKRCQEMGVAVLWIGFGSGDERAQEYCKGTDAVYVEAGESVTDAARLIGAAAVKALQNTGARQLY